MGSFVWSSRIPRFVEVLGPLAFRDLVDANHDGNPGFFRG